MLKKYLQISISGTPFGRAKNRGVPGSSPGLATSEKALQSGASFVSYGAVKDRFVTQSAPIRRRIGRRISRKWPPESRGSGTGSSEQIAVLRFLLDDEPPATLTLDEVLTGFVELGEDTLGDGIRCAVRDLVAVGSLRRRAEFVVADASRGAARTRGPCCRFALERIDRGRCHFPQVS